METEEIEPKAEDDDEEGVIEDNPMSNDAEFRSCFNEAVIEQMDQLTDLDQIALAEKLRSYFERQQNEDENWHAGPKEESEKLTSKQAQKQKRETQVNDEVKALHKVFPRILGEAFKNVSVRTGTGRNGKAEKVTEIFHELDITIADAAKYMTLSANEAMKLSIKTHLETHFLVNLLENSADMDLRQRRAFKLKTRTNECHIKLLESLSVKESLADEIRRIVKAKLDPAPTSHAQVVEGTRNYLSETAILVRWLLLTNFLDFANTEAEMEKGKALFDGMMVLRTDVTAEVESLVRGSLESFSEKTLKKAEAVVIGLKKNVQSNSHNKRILGLLLGTIRNLKEDMPQFCELRKPS